MKTRFQFLRNVLQFHLFILCCLSLFHIQAQNPQWAKSIGENTSNDIGRDIAVDGSGNTYVIGSFEGTDVDFDPSAGGEAKFSTSAATGAFVAKYNSNGDYVWAFPLVGSGINTGYRIAIDGNGNVYITGTFEGTTDFDPGTGIASLTSASFSADIFFAKYDTNGNYQWAYNIGDINPDAGQDIAVDGSGNVYLVGYFQGTNVDFNPKGGTSVTLTSNDVDIFFAKYDSNGSNLWAHNIGGAETDKGKAIGLDASNNVYIAGYFKGSTVNFNPAGSNLLNTLGIEDIFVAKYDQDGKYIWAINVGGSASDYCHDLAIDNNKNVYITGVFNGTADFDPGVASEEISASGSGDIYFAKYDTDGKYQWAKGKGNSSTEDATSIAVDGNNNVYITGVFSGSIDFDFGTGVSSESSHGGSDVFMAKYDTNGGYKWAENLGGSGNDYGYGITVDASNQLYVTGYFSNMVNFNLTGGTANQTSVGGHDIYFAKYCQMPGAAGTITGLATVCQGQSGVVYSVPAIADATGYTWGLPSGASIVSGAGTNSITVNFSVATIDGDITVEGTNACGSGTVSSAFAITLSPLPSVAGTVTGTVTVCKNETSVAYSVPAIANAASYTWALPAGATIISGTGTNNIKVDFTNASVTSGHVSVKGSNACGDGTTSANLAVTITAPATPAISVTSNIASDTIKEDTQVTFTVSVTNGGVSPTYQWKINGADVTNETNPTFTTQALKANDVVSVAMTVSETCVTASTITATASLKVVTVPSQPVDMSGAFTRDTSNSQGYVALSWQASGNESGFYVQRSVKDTNNFVNITTLAPNIITYRDYLAPLGVQVYYKIVAFNVAGEASSSIFSFVLVGTTEPNQATGSLIVYPNPIKQTFKIKLPVLYQGKAHIRILDVRGRLVQDFGYLNTSTLPAQVFDVSAYTKGAYWLKCTIGKHTLTMRLFKQ